MNKFHSSLASIAGLPTHFVHIDIELEEMNMKKKDRNLLTASARQVFLILEELPRQTRIYQQSTAQVYEHEYAGVVKDVVEVFHHPGQVPGILQWNTDHWGTVQLDGLAIYPLQGDTDAIAELGSGVCVLLYYNISDNQIENLPMLDKEEPEPSIQCL